MPGFEPGSLDSKSRVITITLHDLGHLLSYTIRRRSLVGVISLAVMIYACQAWGPGSTPG